MEGGSGGGGSGKVGGSALDDLLCKGLRDTSLPSWVLAVHRRLTFSKVSARSGLLSIYIYTYVYTYIYIFIYV